MAANPGDKVGLRGILTHYSGAQVRECVIRLVNGKEARMTKEHVYQPGGDLENPVPLTSFEVNTPVMILAHFLKRVGPPHPCIVQLWDARTMSVEDSDMTPFGALPYPATASPEIAKVNDSPTE